MSEPGILHTEIKANVGRVMFSHPSGNSFPSALLNDLSLEIERLGNNPEVYVILLSSGGDGAFCAGASFNELLEVDNTESGTRFFSGFARLINAIRKCPKLVIGRVQGKAVGGGVGLAAACDYTLATETALIKLSELAIGIGPFVIAPAVERKIGLAAFTELTLRPQEWKSAYWAKEKGLYAWVFKNVETLDDELETFLGQLTTYHPEALIDLKRTLWQGTEHWDSLLFERAAISGRLVRSEFTRNALAAYKK